MAQYDGDTIRKVSARCLGLFAQNIDHAESLDVTNDLTQSTLQDEFVRFKLWGSNIGVFADVHTSLDFRLREIPDVAELFLRQLDTIEERLNQGTCCFSRQYIITGANKTTQENIRLFRIQSNGNGKVLKFDSRVS